MLEKFSEVSQHYFLLIELDMDEMILDGLLLFRIARSRVVLIKNKR